MGRMSSTSSSSSDSSSSDSSSSDSSLSNSHPSQLNNYVHFAVPCMMLLLQQQQLLLQQQQAPQRNSRKKRKVIKKDRVEPALVLEGPSIYDLIVQDANGSDVRLDSYKGKVLLIVNVASKCGMTNFNYAELNELHNKYKDQGLKILAFPCNQFGNEEPGSNEQILDFVCTRFKSEFPIFNKIEVNGENAAPLYKLLKMGKWGIFGDDIQWNFAKFLVDRDGQVVGRYYPTTSPLSLQYDIEKLLGAGVA